MKRQPMLEAAQGLAVVSDGGALRVTWGDGEDWLGPLDLLAPDAVPLAPAQRFEGLDELGAYSGVELGARASKSGILASVRAYDETPLLVLRLEAERPLGSLASGRFDRPRVAWRFRPRAAAPPAGTRAFGHQYTEFALPTAAGPALDDFFLLPFRPAVVMPLWLRAADGRTLMLAPLDAFHEQVIAVERGADDDEGLRCGWHGDLAAVPAGFATEVALWGDSGPRACLDAWGEHLRQRHATRRLGRYADAGLSHLSYWTDNGSAYWYRTAPGLDVSETLEGVVEHLAAECIPTRAFQLDSWFYPHEKLRSFDTEQHVVPPTGLVRWDARKDVLPDGIPALRKRLGDPPLILHCRHFSSASPYFDDTSAWRDGDRAHPEDDRIYRHLMQHAAAWGAVTFEHDWLIEAYLGVRGLREAPGRARAWQEGVDRAANEQGLTLQWCMASPADFFQSVTLDCISSIRTSGDYRYVIGNAALWAWFLYGNALARALGLLPFKDVFLSAPDGEGLDGDPHAEVEALLAALSAGPVGIGDRIGRSDRALLMRTCRADGMLVKPDVPLAALDRSFDGHAVLEPNPLTAATYSDHPAGRWIYWVTLHVWREDEPLAVRLELGDLDDERLRAPLLEYDWRRRSVRHLERDAELSFRLEPRGWDYRVLVPLLPGEVAVVGDPERYATAGDRRLGDVEVRDGVLHFTVRGAPGESVRILGWAARPPRLAEPEGDVARLRWTEASGVWEIELGVGAAGSLPVALELG